MPGVMGPSGVPNTICPGAVMTFPEQSVFVADQDMAIRGTTVDSTGAVLGSCLVYLYDTATGVIENRAVSDPVTGAYVFYVNPGVTKFAVAYLAGSPDVAGTTVNTLIGT